MQATNKYRKSSLYLALNKQGVRAVKRLIAFAEGRKQGTQVECLANESILRILMEYDPVLLDMVQSKTSDVVSTHA